MVLSITQRQLETFKLVGNCRFVYYLLISHFKIDCLASAVFSCLFLILYQRWGNWLGNFPIESKANVFLFFSCFIILKEAFFMGIKNWKSAVFLKISRIFCGTCNLYWQKFRFSKSLALINLCLTVLSFVSETKFVFTLQENLLLYLHFRLLWSCWVLLFSFLENHVSTAQNLHTENVGLYFSFKHSCVRSSPFKTFWISLFSFWLFRELSTFWVSFFPLFWVSSCV